MSPIHWIIPLCAASFLWSFSFGVSAPLASLWLQAAGFGDTVIGLNTGTYYLGIVMGAILVPRLLRRWGSGCLLVGMIASSLTVAFFPWGGSLSGWFALRALNGVAGALSLIPLETYVNSQSAPERRALNFGYYAFCVALGMALGTLLGVQLFSSMPRTAFVLGGIAPLLGAAVVLGWRPTFPAPAEERGQRARVSLLRNFLSFGSAWSQGFLEGGMVGLLPIYLLSIGLSETVTSCLISGLMIGVITAQVPLAWLADRFGRGRILVVCNVITLVGLSCLLCVQGTVWLGAWLFVVAACSGAFYPLGLALLGDRVPASGLARANACYLAINSFGSLVGPAMAGGAMDLFGRRALFVVGFGTVALVFAGWLALEISSRYSRPLGCAFPAGPDEGPLRSAA